MEENPLTIEEQEHYAINNVIKERDKMSGALRTKMNKITQKETLLGGLAVGFAIGIIVGTIYGQSKSYIPVKNTRGRVIEYKHSGTQMTKAILETIAASLLAAMGLSGIKLATEASRNRDWAEKLATNTLKSYFDVPLNKNADTQPDRIVRAMALVLNNLPQTSIYRLHQLAKSGLKCDANNRFSVSDESITAASQIISNFIQYNPEVGYNVLRIMRGDKPTTYFLPSFSNQKTR